MNNTIAAFEKADVRNDIKLFTDGVSITRKYVKENGADAYAECVATVVDKIKGMV